MTRLTVPRTTPVLANVVREMDEMQNRLRRFFHEGFPAEGLAAEPMGWMPVVEIVENADAIEVTAELPGIKPEQVEVMFEDGILTIRGEKQEEKTTEENDKRFHVWERSYGAFHRAFTVPRAVDPAKITAEFTNGVLKVLLPKAAEAKAKGRQIKVVPK